MTQRRPPAMVRHSAAARKAWRELWSLLDEHALGQDIYAPMVALLAKELGLAEEASAAIYRPVDAATGRRRRRSLEAYLSGRNSQTIPELAVMRDCLRQAAKLAAEFGMSALSQRRAGTGETKPSESPLMAYVRAANERMKRRAS